MKYFKTFSLRFLFVAQLGLTLIVCAYIHLFMPPTIAYELDKRLGTAEAGLDRRALHSRIFDGLPEGDYECELIGEPAGSGGIIYDEVRLMRGYKALIFYSADSDDLRLIGSIVISSRGKPVVSIVRRELVRCKKCAP